VLPVDANVHMLVTGADVIHAWTIPSFGVKVDAIPGRMNELWFKAERVGTYFGQCSELCGKDHAFMPIAVRVVSEAEFETWVNENIAAMTGETPEQVASRRAADTELENAAVLSPTETELAELAEDQATR